MTKTLTSKRLLNDLRGLIVEARQDVARQAGLTNKIKIVEK